MIDENNIIKFWNRDKHKQPFVSIICHAYNHEKFIEDAICGFLMQKTTFPFEVIIHDDASTDSTREIIEKYVENYPNILRPLFQKENQYSKKRSISANFTYPVSRGKYIALCEGDDYWTDEYKLQKQIEFLENNSEYVVTWTNFDSKDGDNLIDTGYESLYPDVHTLDFENVFEYYITYTLTAVFRKDAIDYKRIHDFKYAKDNTIYSLLLVNGKGAFLNFKSAVYRWHQGGVFSLKSEFFKKYSSYLNIKEIYDNIKESRTKNMEFTYKELYKQAADEALKMFVLDSNKEKSNLKFLFEYFLQANLKEKKVFFKKYLALKKGLK